MFRNSVQAAWNLSLWDKLIASQVVLGLLIYSSLHDVAPVAYAQYGYGDPSCGDVCGGVLRTGCDLTLECCGSSATGSWYSPTDSTVYCCSGILQTNSPP